MIEQLTTVFTAVLGWFGNFVTALTTSEGSLYALLPLLFIGVAVSLIMVGVKIVRKIMWGN